MSDPLSDVEQVFTRYRQRVCNPFMGAVSVLEGSDARALSRDGRLWQIQAKALPPQNLWGSVREGGEKRYFRFGHWTQEEGLDRIPLNPLIDTKSMLIAAEGLIAELAAAINHLPFPATDQFELWLLDGLSRQPLVLMDTATERTIDEAIQDPVDTHWHATRNGDFSFISTTLDQLGIPNKDDHSPRRHADAVEALVRHRADPGQNLQWFHRHCDGRGDALRTGDPRIPDPHKSTAEFPELLLSEQWPGDTDRRLVEDYLAWQAPRLLMLDLSEPTRERLERAASVQPLEMDRLWHLYPQILNQERLIKVRVEARIRRASLLGERASTA